MEPTASGIIPDLFAANAASLRRLARGLLAEEGEAEDVFQETWLELLRHPPRRSESLPGWLRAVLRNLARKRRRGEERRARREHAAARAEALEASRHLGEDLRAKLHDREPLIIRFEFGPGVSVMGRRRYF